MPSPRRALALLAACASVAAAAAADWAVPAPADCVRQRVPGGVRLLARDGRDGHAAHVHRMLQAAHEAAAGCRGAHDLVFKPAGGWGDQIRGMVTAFYAAALTHRGFAATWSPLFSVDDYFETHLSTYSRDAGAGALAAPVITAVDNFTHFKEPAAVDALLALPGSAVLHTNAFQWAELARAPPLRAAAEHLGVAGLSQEALYVLAVQVMLPRPAPAVEAHVNAVLGHAADTRIEFGRRMAHGQRRRHSLTIGVQIRTGGVGEAWVDSGLRHPLASADCFAAEAARLCGGARCLVFLTADSDAAASRFKAALSTAAGAAAAVVEHAGPVLHTDRPVPAAALGKPPTDPWQKTFVDWTALSQVDALLMSRSGFGWTAGWAGRVPYMRMMREDAECTWIDFDTPNGLF
jgi:hypothetical protein